MPLHFRASIDGPTIISIITRSSEKLRLLWDGSAESERKIVEFGIGLHSVMPQPYCNGNKYIYIYIYI